VAGSFLGLIAIEGTCSTLLVGRRSQTESDAGILALWFSGLFWGIAVYARDTVARGRQVIAENSAHGRPRHF